MSARRRPEIPPLALTLGDPAGIGPEISCKAWERLRGSDTVFALIAPGPALALFGDVPIVRIEHVGQAAEHFDRALPVWWPADAEHGAEDPSDDRLAIASIDHAFELVWQGEAGAMVTNPISKARAAARGFAHPGHTEYLGALCRARGTPAPAPVMMLAARDLRVALVSVHLPIRQVSAAITADAVSATVRTVNAALVRDFAIERPRIAVAGLNPHAGEGGQLGTEERETIAPAIALCRSEGIDVTGPHPADTLFHQEARSHHDAVVCHYHDQGLIPIKMLDFWGGVNMTLGLPIVRTSPDHGTAFDIVGRGIARPDSLIAALEAAHMVACRRARAS
jgi:4-hydroxythreonine-4-phosphate dehydrogenase